MASGAEAFDQQTDHNREGSQLGSATNHEGHHRGGTVVHVRNPHVEGNRTKFEGKACHHEHQTQHQHLLGSHQRGLATSNGLHHTRQIERASGAIDHGQAVQQEAAGQSAEHEILHGSFGRIEVIAPQGNEGIAGQSEQLKAEVDHQEVVTRDHHEHTQQRIECKGVQLTATHHFTLTGISPAIHNGHQHGNRCKTL